MEVKKELQAMFGLHSAKTGTFSGTLSPVSLGRKIHLDVLAIQGFPCVPAKTGLISNGGKQLAACEILGLKGQVGYPSLL